MGFVHRSCTCVVSSVDGGFARGGGASTFIIKTDGDDDT